MRTGNATVRTASGSMIRQSRTWSRSSRRISRSIERRSSAMLLSLPVRASFHHDLQIHCFQRLWYRLECHDGSFLRCESPEQRRIRNLWILYPNTHRGWISLQYNHPIRKRTQLDAPSFRKLLNILWRTENRLSQLRLGALDQDLSPVDDAYRVCQFLGLGQVVRADDDGSLSATQSRDLVAHQPRRLRVHG